MFPINKCIFLDFSSSDSEFNLVVHTKGSTDLEESDSDKFVQKINKMAKRISSAISHNSPVATTSSQLPSISSLQIITAPPSTLDPSQLVVPQITDLPKSPAVTSSPKSPQQIERKRKNVYDETYDIKSRLRKRPNEGTESENTARTKRRKKKYTHSSNEVESLKRKSYSSEIFALQRLDINNENEENSLEPEKDHLNKKPKLDS